MLSPFSADAPALHGVPIGWLVLAGLVVVLAAVLVIVALRRRRRCRAAASTAAAATTGAPAAIPDAGNAPEPVARPVEVGAAPGGGREDGPAGSREPGAPAEAADAAAPDGAAPDGAAPGEAAADSVTSVGATVSSLPTPPAPASSADGGPEQRPRTVGDLAAVRDVDTTPLPIRSDVLLMRAAARQQAGTSAQVRVPASGPGGAVPAQATSADYAAPWLRVDLTLPAAESAADRRGALRPPAAAPRPPGTTSAAAPRRRGTSPAPAPPAPGSVR
ncbi:hypothetical protein ACFQV8_35515 [Pseudonocardia benzenivorans]